MLMITIFILFFLFLKVEKYFLPNFRITVNIKMIRKSEIMIDIYQNVLK